MSNPQTLLDGAYARRLERLTLLNSTGNWKGPRMAGRSNGVESSTSTRRVERPRSGSSFSHFLGPVLWGRN